MILQQILIFFVLILFGVCNLNDFFCFPLCALSQCQGIQQDKCRNCTAGFKKATATTTSNCIVITPMVNGQRYQPISVTEDITYPLLGTEPISTLNVTVNNIQLTPDQQCSIVNNTDYEYIYYGDFISTTVVNIKAPYDIFITNIFRVRLRFWLITIDEWDQLAKLSIKFLSNTSQAVKTYSLKDASMNQSTQICGDPLFPQRYQIYDAEFSYNISTAPEFQLAILANTFSNPWGIKQVLLMVRVCHFYCIGCTGDSNGNCLACDYATYPGLMKSGATCALSCAGGYGINITDPQVCLKCMTNCYRCFAASTNCTQCNGGYFIYTVGTNISCVLNCPTHFFKNLTGYDFCDTCSPTCQNCSLIKTNCTSCYTATYLYNYNCYNPCPVKTFSSDLTLQCYNCSATCYECVGIAVNCTSCVIGGPVELYLKNNTCITDCGDGYYKFNNLTIGPYVCLQCDTNCTTCEINATYCYNCSPNYFLYENYCGATCPTQYFSDNNTWTCLSCALYCVGLQTNLFFKDNLKQQLIFELIFTQDLAWNSTDIQNFIIIEQNSPQLTISDHFTLTYQILNPRQYHIIVEPKGYIYLKKIIFTFKNNSTLQPFNPLRYKFLSIQIIKLRPIPEQIMDHDKITRIFINLKTNNKWCIENIRFYIGCIYQQICPRDQEDWAVGVALYWGTGYQCSHSSQQSTTTELL